VAKRVDDKLGTWEYIFRDLDPKLEEMGLVGVPITSRQKSSPLKGWQQLIVSAEERALRRERFPSHGIGVLAGTTCLDGSTFGFVDVDEGALVPFVEAVFGTRLVAKVGQKGLTIFCRFESGPKSFKVRMHGGDRPAVEVMITSGQTVLPPSWHPSGKRYEWPGPSLFDQPLDVLPLVDHTKLKIIELVVKNESARKIVEGGAGVHAHDLMLKLTSCGVANLTDDLEWLARCLNSLFVAGYDGNTESQTVEMLQSALKKNLGAKSQNTKPTIADACLALPAITQLELFHTDLKEAYATITTPSGGPLTYAVRSGAFRLRVKGAYFEATGKALPKDKADEVLDLLESRALFASPQLRVHLRYAEQDGSVFVDLGDESGAAVKITPEGWSIETSHPVKFRRGTGMRPLPVPLPGGSLEPLRALLGLSNTNWLRVLGFILSCLNPNGPFFFLLIEAEQGSGKSVLSAAIKRITDAHRMERMRIPRTDHDVMIQAKESWLLNYDNASKIPDYMSDMFCAISTGASFGTRRYYSDDALRLIDACRPAVFNGIGEYARRPDFVDRSIPLHLPTFSGERREEREIFSELDEMLPGVLGCFYDAVAHALRFRDNVSVSPNIRMIDAARWIAAAEPALGVPEGSILEVIAEGQSGLAADVIANDPLFLSLRLIVKEVPFAGMMTDLFLALESSPLKNGLPKSPAALSNALRRMAPAARVVGLNIQLENRDKTGRPVRVYRDDQDPQKGVATWSSSW